MEGKGYGFFQAKEKEMRQGYEEEGEEMETRGNSDDGVGSEDVGSAFRGGNRTGESLTWTSSEKPVCAEPSKMELRVVPTYSVSPLPSAIVRTGPKSSGT